MKITNNKTLLVTIVILVTLALTTLSGCITITTPEITPAPAPAETPTFTPEPIDPGWAPKITDNRTTELPSIADVVALVKPSVVFRMMVIIYGVHIVVQFIKFVLLLVQPQEHII